MDGSVTSRKKSNTDTEHYSYLWAKDGKYNGSVSITAVHYRDMVSLVATSEPSLSKSCRNATIRRHMQWAWCHAMSTSAFMLYGRTYSAWWRVTRQRENSDAVTKSTASAVVPVRRHDLFPLYRRPSDAVITIISSRDGDRRMHHAAENATNENSVRVL